VIDRITGRLGRAIMGSAVALALALVLAPLISASTAGAVPTSEAWGVAGSIPLLGTNPSADAVSTDASHVWVADPTGSVTEIDIASRAIVGSPLHVPGQPIAISSDGTHVWVGTERYRSTTGFWLEGMTEIDASTGKIIRNSTYQPGEFNAICSNGTYVWALDFGTLTEFNASTGLQIGPAVSTGYHSGVAITCNATDVWELDQFGEVTQVSDSTGTIVNQFLLPATASAKDIASDGTDVWVAASGTIVKIDAVTGAMVGLPIAMPYNADWIASDGTNVWVAENVGGYVTQVSAATGAVGQSFPILDAPTGVALEGSNVWVVSQTALYLITPSITDVTLTPSNSYALTTGRFTASFTTSPVGALSGSKDDVVVVDFPPGFGLPASPSAILSSGFVGSCASAPAANFGNGLLAVLLPLGCSAGISTAVTVTFKGITNPAAGTYPPSDFFVSTFEDQPIVEPVTAVTIIPETAPSAPTGVGASPLAASTAVTWTPSVSNGGSPITSYTAVARDPSNVVAGTCTSVGSPPPVNGCTITGLANGTTYSVIVRATNAIGSSPRSSPAVSVTPGKVPRAPLNVVAIAGSGQATITWDAPASNGGLIITGYTVTASPGSNTCAWTTGPLTCTVSGLIAGDPYTFTVTATNARGTGAASVVSNSVQPS